MLLVKRLLTTLVLFVIFYFFFTFATGLIIGGVAGVSALANAHVHDPQKAAELVRQASMGMLRQYGVWIELIDIFASFLLATGVACSNFFPWCRPPGSAGYSGAVGCGGILIVLVLLAGIFVIFLWIKTPARLLRITEQELNPAAAGNSSHSDYAAAVAAAQKEAVRRYPALGVAGSEMNKRFVAKYNQYKQQKPDYFTDPIWPIKLADETNNLLMQPTRPSALKPMAPP